MRRMTYHLVYVNCVCVDLVLLAGTASRLSILSNVNNYRILMFIFGQSYIFMYSNDYIQYVSYNF